MAQITDLNVSPYYDDIDETDKKIAKQTEKARKKYHKWCDRREKEQKKKGIDND